MIIFFYYKELFEFLKLLYIFIIQIFKIIIFLFVEYNFKFNLILNLVLSQRDIYFFLFIYSKISLLDYINKYFENKVMRIVKYGKKWEISFIN